MAFKTFVTDSKHVPHITSLLLSAFASSLTQKLLFSIPMMVFKKAIYPVIGRRIFLPTLNLMFKAGTSLTLANPIVGFTLQVGHMILFFTWEDILGPPIERAWDLRKYSDEMDHDKISILEHLTAGYNQQPIPIVQQPTTNINRAGLAGFLTSIFSNNPLSPSQREATRDNLSIRRNLIGLLNASPDQNPLQYSDKNNQHFPEILLDIPNLTDQIETNLPSGEITKARGDVLLESIFQLNLHIQHYRETLLKEFYDTQYRWAEFFKPAISWQYTTRNFYEHIIRTQKQINFETEPKLPAQVRLSPQSNTNPRARHHHNTSLFSNQNNKSRGMLDALYFASRSLDSSNGMFTNRLLDESNVLRLGVEPHIVHQLSNSDLQRLYQRLSSEHSFFGNPTENHGYLVSLLNKGFDISQMYNFEDFDFQVRIEFFENDDFKSTPISPNILYTKSTQEIYDFMNFLKDQPISLRYYYIRFANDGWSWNQLLQLTDNDMTVLTEATDLGLNPDILKLKNTQEIYEFTRFVKNQPEGMRDYYIHFANHGWDWSRLRALTSDNLDVLKIALNLKLDQEFLKTTSIQNIQQAVEFLESQPEEDRDSIANAFSIIKKEPSNVLTQNTNMPTSIVQSGAEYFNPSSNNEGLRHYGIIYYSTLEKLLISMVCGDSVEEIDLIQRSGFGLGSLEFNAPRIWKDRPTLCDQIETVHHAFLVQENNQDVYYYNLLDYVSKNVGDQITLEGFEEFWEKQVTPGIVPVLSEYMERQTTVLREELLGAYNNNDYSYRNEVYDNELFFEYYFGDIEDMRRYALGIYQFERDITDYYLNLLMTLLPKQPPFLDNLYSYTDCIRLLSEYPGHKFEQIITDSTCADQLEQSLGSSMGEILAITSNAPQQVPMIHEATLVQAMRSTYNYIQQQLPNDQNSVALLEVVNIILENIRQSILHSSEKDKQINVLSST